LALHITRPLRTLRAATNGMANGHLGLRTGIARSDEIGQLARSFDDMATSLERQHRERLEAETALHASEARYRQLVELSPVPIAVHADARYVYANPAAARLLGVASPEGLVGLPVAQTLPPRDRAAFAAI